MSIGKMTTRKKYKVEQVSHKVIEKRRRDRINNCLTELSQTVPAAFAKQTSGKLEKAEILEMTVDYLRAISSLGQKFDNGDWLNPLLYTELQRHYAAGYGDCVREVFRYVTEVEGQQMSDSRCTRMMTYLQTKGCSTLIESAIAQAGASTNDMDIPPKPPSPTPEHQSASDQERREDTTTPDGEASTPPPLSHATSPAPLGSGSLPSYPMLGACFPFAEFQSCPPLSDSARSMAYHPATSFGRISSHCFGCSSSGGAATGAASQGSPPSTSSAVATDFLSLQFASKLSGYGASSPHPPPPPPAFSYAAEFLPYGGFHSKHASI